MRHLLSITLTLLVAAPATAAPQEGGVTREQQALSDEQSLIVRKLARLRASMDRLAERYETEGRTHAARLLREALVHLDERQAQRSSKTLDELMTSAESGLGAGQVVQAIEDQKAIVADLERLLSILMDRPDLDQLQNELEQLRQFTERLRGLAKEESEIRKELDELREQAKNDAQRELEASLARMQQQQAELLANNERDARESGAMQLEALEQRLDELLQDQETDLAVAKSWNPATREQLEAWLAPLESARAESYRQERLEAAAERLRDLARAGAPDAAEGDLQRALAEVEAAAEREDRHARAGNDPAARRAADALQRAAKAAREGRPAEADAAAAELEAAAEQRGAAADEARRALAEAASEDDAVGDDLREALERAAEQGDAESTARALAELRRALDEQRFLGQALSASQDQNAKRAEQIAEGLERSDATPEAREALERAAESMREASQAADRNDAQSSAQSAQQAAEALREALQSMQQAREAGAQQDGGMAESQRSLSEQTAALEQQSSEASLSPQARESVQEALESAARAMEEAAEALEEGRRSDAAAKQREALQELSEASRASESGTQPQDQESRERAEQLAEKQRAVEKRLYEFRKAYEESQRETPLPSLEAAEQHAKRAGERMQQGDLDEAEREAERAEREIEDALDELAEEERQYQRLRDEELLFQIAEEVALMIETHERLSTELVELDSERKPGARATRAQKLRLRKLSREVQALADRGGELRGAISREGSTVFAELFQRIEDDLVRIARTTGEMGGYQSGGIVQGLFDDVGRDLAWLLESLEEEKDRRQEEDAQQDGGGGEQPGQEGENRLVPDEAELKLLTRMEGDVLDSLDELLVLYPELSEGGDIDPLLLEEITRLAARHRRTTELFSSFRERLGLPDPTASPNAQ